MERRETEIEHRRAVPDQPPVGTTSSEVVSRANPGRRAMDLVYLFFGVIDGLLLIRLVLKLLGANTAAGFTQWVYGVTNVLLAPFRNLLPTIGSEHSVLEMSVVVAILVYALIAWAMARLMAIIFFRDVTIARRGFF
jgi:YggT family protein